MQRRTELRTMDDQNSIIRSLREAGPHYVVDAQQQTVGVLLTLAEYERYRELDRQAEARPLARSGVPGRQLVRFAGAIPPDDLQLMQQAIEADCERVDANEWYMQETPNLRLQVW